MKILKKRQQNLPGYHQRHLRLCLHQSQIPGGTSSAPMTQDSVPLPIPRLPITHQEERKTSTSSSTHSDPPPIALLFNINRANVGAASSVLSLDEGEGIVNDDEYERAVHRIEKINKKITILVRNWNEESKLANTPMELIEIDEFYRPYMDQYNARWKMLERLMDMYVENFKEVTPKGSQHPEYSTDRVMPWPAPRTSRASKKEKIEKVTTDERVPPYQGSSSDETSLKQGVEEKIPTLIPTGEQIITTIRPTTSVVTPPLVFSHSFPITTTETVTPMKIPGRGKLSTLSSVVRPTPTTATRTVVITREESRQDTIETARKLIGSASPTTYPHMSITPLTSRESHTNEQDETNQSRTEMRTRPISLLQVPQETPSTTPVGMAAPIAPDLIWPSHPDIQGTSLFPQDDDPSTVAVGGLDPKRWKIHHPYDIPGVRRPTMDTPDNLRRLAESEALVESLRTMEYLTEFPTLEERRDFR